MESGVKRVVGGTNGKLVKNKTEEIEENRTEPLNIVKNKFILMSTLTIKAKFSSNS